MLIFNHVSYVDGIILGAYFLPCGLAKASIADIPFFGTFCRVCLRISSPLAEHVYCTVDLWGLAPPDASACLSTNWHACHGYNNSESIICIMAGGCSAA